jgi:hypothetical protein
MKITVTVPLTVEVELDTEGEILHEESVRQDVGYALFAMLSDDSTSEAIVDTVSEYTGWAVKSFSMFLDDKPVD